MAANNILTGTGRMINSFANACSEENSGPFGAVNGIFSMKRVRLTGNSASCYDFVVKRFPYGGRGRQYLREISGNGIDFGPPRMLGGHIRSVVPWSRIFDDREILLAMNTDYASPRSAWVTIDDGLHQTGQTLTCLYSTDSGQIGQEVTVESRNGKAVVLTLPPGGLVIYE
jgi:hypothetical protein